MAVDNPKKVAIIGSGCAGLGAAWALQSTQHEVHIYEAQNRLGGHTNTQEWRSPTSGKTTPVDTGFIVMNTATYPNFIRFLEQVRVPTAPTEMTFGVSRDQGKFEWSGNPEGIFAQRRNLFRLQHWRMIFDIIRFNQFALDLLKEEDEATASQGRVSPKSPTAAKTIGAYLHEQGYSQAFKDDYLIPMTAAVWSTSPDKASLDFPAITLVRFMWNHHLLSTISSRPLWLTIPGGSKKYIDAIVKRASKEKFHVHTSRQATEVNRLASGKLQVQAGPDHVATYDHVIFACHGDEILPLLTPSGSASPMEEELLSHFQTTANVAYLHSDLTLMPKRRKVYTAWNYLTSSAPSQLEHPAGVALTYWMNLLQHLPKSEYGPVLVTMNPPYRPAHGTVQGEYHYNHPLYTTAAVAAQKQLDVIQNVHGVSYAGAWTKYGFHEDGFSSGLKVAIDHLGAKLPFEFKDSTFSRGHRPTLGARDRLVRLIITILQFFVLALVWAAGLWPIAFGLRVLEGTSEMVITRLEAVGKKRQ